LEDLKEEVKGGYIKFRYPNPIEAMHFVGECKLGDMEMDSYKKIAFICENLGRVITEVKVKRGKESLESYDQLTSDMDYLKPISRIGSKIYGHILEAYAKED